MDKATPTRLTAGGLYTQAGNFLSHVSNGVDARTGQMTLHIALPELQTNDLAGPSVSLRLLFSPLSSHTDYGFGRGWMLAMSELDLPAGRLHLATGESFSLDRQASAFTDQGQLVFTDQKLLNFRVLQEGQDSRRFRVEYKDGETQWLVMQDNSGLALPQEIRSAEGRQVFLDWQPHGSGRYVLSEIRDEQRVVLRVVRNVVDEFQIQHFPDDARRSIYTLHLSGDQLSTLILPDDDSRWTFSYDEYDGLLFPSRITGPLGSEDEVWYATGSEGHQLPPGAPLASLPRVTAHRHDPGAGQPAVSRSYTWLGSTNFLGNGADLPGGWRDGEDNLYRTESYTYTGLEALHSETGQLLAETERSWNRFHLLTHERVTRHGKTVTTTTDYGDDPALGWEDQPAWCQLPIQVTTRYEDAQGAREETAHTTYDSYGNTLEQRHADGRVEHWVYYPLGGADGVVDTQMFVRWVQHYTLTPATVESGGTGGAPITQTQFRYEALPRRQADDRLQWVVVSEEAFTVTPDGPDLIGRTTQRYDTAIDSPFFAQVTQAQTANNGFITTTDYNRTLTATALTTHTQVTGHDGTCTSNGQVTRDNLTGLTLIDREEGSETVYEYDALGRVVRSTVAPGTAYEASATCRYVLAGRYRQHAVMAEETDLAGQQRRIYLDGAGRRVREERRDDLITGEVFREIWRGVYNVEGQLLQETSQDWFPEREQPMSLTTTYEFDEWGQVSTIKRPDGTLEHTQTSPITLTSEIWRESRDGIITAKTRILRNSAGDVLNMTLLARNDEILRSETWTHDGLHRPLSHTVNVPGEVSVQTQTRYDVHGRITRRRLEDDSEVDWEFAPHSDADHPVSITLTPVGRTAWSLGKQTFDGIGRPVNRTVGGLQDCLNYQEGQKLPASRTSSSGRSLAYRYEPLLENQLTQLSPGDVSQDSIFQYDFKSGQMIQALGPFGKLTWQYSSTGRLLSEHLSLDSQVYNVGWTRSLEGRLLTFKDSNGAEHHTVYDVFGRPERQLLGVTELQITYDTFGRVSQYLTQDPAHSLKQTVHYDEFSREVSRTWVSDNQRQLTQTLTWTGRDQMASRRWEEENRLLSEEVFRYDARARLVEVSVTGPQGPKDPRTGQPISKQAFTLNALDGYEQVITTYMDGNSDVMKFTYEPIAPDRPISITHTYPAPQTLTLEYDADGRLLRDGLGRTLQWDAEGRLSRVTSDSGQNDYHYDPMGRATQTTRNGAETLWFYQGDRLISTRGPGPEATLSLLRDEASVFAQNKVAQAVREVLLTGCDGQGTVQVESAQQTSRVSYTAHGADVGSGNSLVGYAGEPRGLVEDGYLLGSYRPYDPYLMLFLAPDNDSPFGAGGLNRYAYCAGDPLNRVDPDGHSFWKWLVAGIGLAIGVLATVASFGAAAPAVAGVIAGGLTTLTASGALAVTSVALGVVATTTGAASLILEATGNTEAASILGTVSLITGIGSGVTALAPTASKAISKLGQFVGRWQKKLQSAGGVPRLGGQAGSLRTGPSATLSGMPDHVLGNIGRYLPGRDLVNFSVTSRQMNQAANTYSRPALHALPVAPEGAPNYVNAVRRIWAGGEPGVFPSSLRQQGINPRAVVEGVPPSSATEYVSVEWIQATRRDHLYADALDLRNSWYLLERTARQQARGRRYSL
ncbi:RHS repeat-associated core domain-containing protein [Pseudomonas sp. A-R-26]|uniref:RHS repeat-associated core domain-containing protein n=1 Tax=Pseudomonas sp. A-R-26 TaxID=2832404 RepID=UPI001CBB96AD|nr:RHS repeat-associated core domain-containing protein [Pseudomonas sp. A-R-26]